MSSPLRLGSVSWACLIALAVLMLGLNISSCHSGQIIADYNAAKRAEVSSSISDRQMPPSTLGVALETARNELKMYDTKSMPSLIICAMGKDNHAATREWLLFHALQGVDHVYFYDDGSSPPLVEAGVFVGLEHLVTVKPWAHAAPNADTHQHGNRQLLAYRECGRLLNRTNTVLMTIDTDEYVWPCDPLVPIAVTMRRAAVERGEIQCPRFGPITFYQQNRPLVEQYTRRSPQHLLGEPEGRVKSEIPGCYSMVPGEGHPCFSHRPKSLYDMMLLSSQAISWLSIHGVENGHKGSSFNVSSALLTTGSRQHGVCCNHYFSKDMQELRMKAEKNKNGFYTALLESDNLLSFYNHTYDTLASNRFTKIMEGLLKLLPLLSIHSLSRSSDALSPFSNISRS